MDLAHQAKNETLTTAIPRTSPPESWTSGKIRFCPKTDVWGVGMTIFEILNMRPMPKLLTEMKYIEGTQAIKPKKLLLDDITIGNSFTRLDELWFITSKCWYKNPWHRPQVWEVEEKIA